MLFFFIFMIFPHPVYNEAGKSPPTRDKLQPENKAQVRSGRGNRETDATGNENIFPIYSIYCFQLPI